MIRIACDAMSGDGAALVDALATHPKTLAAVSEAYAPVSLTIVVASAGSVHARCEAYM
ncbi:MAG: hypothetical protein IH877_06800 [Gemmatimonadetes bacterium]|nr:hypothetical protein [Gemmatimonadota bacterium]